MRDGLGVRGAARRILVWISENNILALNSQKFCQKTNWNGNAGCLVYSFISPDFAEIFLEYKISTVTAWDEKLLHFRCYSEKWKENCKNAIRCNNVISKSKRQMHWGNENLISIINISWLYIFLGHATEWGRWNGERHQRDALHTGM